jgi:hypothetical protein
LSLGRFESDFTSTAACSNRALRSSAMPCSLSP